MQKIIGLFIIFCLLFLNTTGAQDMKNTLDSYFETVGSVVDWKKVQNYIGVGRTELELKLNNITLDKSISSTFLSDEKHESIFIEYKGYPLKSRMDFLKDERWTSMSNINNSIKVSIDGSIFPSFSKIETGHPLRFYEKFKNKYFFPSFIFLNYGLNEVYTIDYLGQETIESKAFNVLKVEFREDGQDFYYYFNTGTKLLEYELLEKSNLTGGRKFEDYRIVDGLLIPFKIKTSLENVKHTMQYDYIELNSPIFKDELFDPEDNYNSFINENQRRVFLLSKLKKE